MTQSIHVELGHLTPTDSSLGLIRHDSYTLCNSRGDKRSPFFITRSH